jgi:hypothetical protein
LRQFVTLSMVIMEKIDDDYAPLASQVYRHLYDVIKAKLEELHQVGLVQRDVRDANITVHETKCKFLILG